MDRRAELSEFLRTTRARRQPEDLGLTPIGGRRRVPGLRREELAQAAGVSVDYYIRLEQGRLPNPSESVVDAVANALALDRSERIYLHNLARRRRPAPDPAISGVRPTVQWMLDALEVPATVCGRRGDILAWNGLMAALLVDFAEFPVEQRNMAWLLFLNDELASKFPAWEEKARDVVALLRMDSSRNPNDERLAWLIGELSMKSTEFTRLWSSRRVREKVRGSHRHRHPVAGEFTLHYETFPLPDNPEQTLVCHVAEPGSRDEEALRLLASWTCIEPERHEFSNGHEPDQSGSHRSMARREPD